MMAPRSPIVLNPASLVNSDLMRSTGAFMGIPSRANRFGGRRNARFDSTSRVCRPTAAAITFVIVALCACRRVGEK